ncbi:MAG: hypothetical protein V2B18_25690 [Pseudomonadota bacterium]
MSLIPEPVPEEPEIPIPSRDDDEAWEDYMDYCAVVESLEEALKNPGGIKDTRAFARELGFDF